MPTARGYVSHPGSAGNYVVTPDTPANSPTGDMTLVWVGSMDDWTPGATKGLMAKWNGGSKSFILEINATGFPGLDLNDGSDRFAGSSAATGITDGTVGGVKVEYRVSDRRVQFFTSADFGTTWSQLGSNQTMGGAAATTDSTSQIEIGAFNAGTSGLLAGHTHLARLYNGLHSGGSATLVAEMDASTAANGAPTVVGSTGETWTLQGTAALVNALAQRQLLTSGMGR